MASFNKLIIIGNLAENPELKQTQSGIYVSAFSVAAARGRKSKEAEQKTDFINCVAWRNTAEFICKHFEKGKPILLEGELHQEAYEKNGEKRYTWQMEVQQAYFVEKSKFSPSTT